MDTRNYTTAIIQLYSCISAHSSPLCPHAVYPAARPLSLAGSIFFLVFTLLFVSEKVEAGMASALVRDGLESFRELGMGKEATVYRGCSIQLLNAMLLSGNTTERDYGAYRQRREALSLMSFVCYRRIDTNPCPCNPNSM